MSRSNRLGLAAVLASMLALAGCATNGNGPDGMHRADTPSSRENAARVHTELGQGYLREGNLKRALSKLNSALQFDPDYAPAHTVLGALYVRIGEMSKAEQNYRRAVQLKPKDGNTNANFGAFLCLQEGKVAEAMPYFKKALADPFYQTPEVAWTNAGQCQMRASHYKQAETDLGKALKFNPNYSDALYQMALALYTQGDAFHASAFIQRFHALGRSTPAALKLGYDIATRLGDAEGAQNYARQLRTKFPDSEQAQALARQASP